MLVLKKYLARYRFRDILTVLVEEYGGFFLRNFPGYEGILLRHLLYRCTFKSLGRGSTIHTNVRINHSYRITAGQYLNINWGTLIDGRGGIEIGDYALIGPGVYIGSTNHIINPTRGEPRALQNHTDQPVKIGSNTWIGANCMICPGVTIGDNSIVAAGSVVTRDVPPMVLAAGNPAKVKRQLELV